MSSLLQKRSVRIAGIVVAVLVVLIVIGSLLLDGILTRKAQAQAALYSQRLGRPLKVESVSTRILTGLGATVSGVEVGAGPGEDLPLAQVQRLEVRVAALRALFSLGKDVEVRSVEVHQPLVNVVRLGDGTTNVERLQSRLAQLQPEKPEAKEAPRDLSAVRVAHAAVIDGRIRLVDHTAGTPRELTISDLDVTLDDLRAGKSLDVVLKAAVLAKGQNLELRLHTAPLPNSLQPTPERIALKVQPVDLAPLAPFLPKDVGLQAGRLDADWTAELGAAVPGGTGPTRAKGGVHARGLRFAATGAAPLDVALDTDLDGNAESGDLDIRTLSFAAGPAGITGHGRVRGLASERPSIENFEIVGHDLDLAVLGRSFPPLARALKGEVSGPIGLRVNASGTQAAPALALTLDFTPVQIAIPEQLAKAAGAPMKLVAQLRGAGRKTYRFDADAQLSGVDLRPGMLLNKPPGKQLQLTARGTLQRGSTTHLKLDGWTVRILDDTLSGTAAVDMEGQGKQSSTKFLLTARAPRIDADALLLESNAPAPAPAGPPPDPHRFEGLRGNLHAEVQTLLFHKVNWRNLIADVSVVDDLATVNRLSLDAVGGQLRADGTTVHLGPADHPFDLKLSARGLDLAQTLTFAGTGKGKAFAGTFDGVVALSGRGTSLSTLEKTLSGTVNGDLKNGAFLGADLVSAVAGPLGKALPFATKSKDLGRTSLGDSLPIALTVDKGVARLNKPIVVNTPEAALNLGGAVGLGGQLDLGGTVALTPSTVHSLTGGRVKPSENIPLALKLSGPAWAPQISGVDVRPAALTIAKLAGGSAFQSLFGKKAGDAASSLLSPSGGTGGSKGQNGNKSESERLKQQAEEDALKQLQNLFGK
jgi:AsmA protein